MSELKRWILLDADEQKVQQLQEALKIHPVLCKLLVLRNITTYEDARKFFNPNLDDLHDPFLMQDMDKAVERIRHAIEQNEKILVYGDYDVDGTTSVALIYSFFSKFYDNLITYIPDRYSEGYGISFQGIDYAKAHQVTLIIALDCGIKAHDKIDYANQNNIDFIICDHHLPAETVPDAVAVLDPKRNDCHYPYKELSGCGIGFKLIQAYAQTCAIDKEWVYEGLDLVAASIASDLVHITGENRVLAKFGIDKVNTQPRAGIQALINDMKISRKLEISDLVFIIGPRINAAGRIAHGLEAVELLVAKDLEIALSKIKKVQENNDTRKEFDKDITEEAFAIIDNDERQIRKKSTVLYRSHWHKGVIGIVASRLIDKYHRPTIIITESNGKGVGSGRSVPGFDIHEAIDACSDCLIQFGGHKYAAGLTIELDKIEAFIEKFEDVVSQNITDELLITPIEIDAEIEFSDITEKFFNIIERMAPFGPENMRPVFITKEVYDTGFSKIVKEAHLKLHLLKDGQNPMNGIGFGMANLYNTMEEKETFDVCYQLYANEWNGQTKIELRLKDIK
jgi:single-stranded-DNA-specific exonuclease